MITVAYAIGFVMLFSFHLQFGIWLTISFRAKLLDVPRACTDLLQKKTEAVIFDSVGIWRCLKRWVFSKWWTMGCDSAFQTREGRSLYLWGPSRKRSSDHVERWPGKGELNGWQRPMHIALALSYGSVSFYNSTRFLISLQTARGSLCKKKETGVIWWGWRWGERHHSEWAV